MMQYIIIVFVSEIKSRFHRLTHAEDAMAIKFHFIANRIIHHTQRISRKTDPNELMNIVADISVLSDIKISGTKKVHITRSLHAVTAI
jgi:hypothetical protein